ncbi:MAG: lysostaphin resistance A-like protein [Faecousia sp.]
MEEKQINKWLRRRFAVVGWALVVYYLILNILVSLTMAVDAASRALRAIAAGRFPWNYDVDALMGNAWGYLLAIAVGAVVLYAWKGRDYCREEILAKEKPMTASAFFAVLSLTVGAQLVNSLWVGILELILNWFGRSAVAMLENVSGSADTVSLFLYSGFAAPIAEEILFRGLVLRSLKPFGKRFAIFGSALLFGAFHGNLLQTPYAFLVGLVLGYVTVEYSIGWAVALHMFNNLVLADFLTRLTASLPAAAASGVQVVILGGFALAGAVILFVKRREVRDYNRSEWMDRRCLKCFFSNSGVLVMLGIALVSMASLLFV